MSQKLKSSKSTIPPNDRTHLCSSFCHESTCRKFVLSRRILRVDWTGAHTRSTSKIKSADEPSNGAPPRRSGFQSGNFHFRRVVSVVWNLSAYARRRVSRSGEASRWEKDTCTPDACLLIDPRERESCRGTNFRLRSLKDVPSRSNW